MTKIKVTDLLIKVVFAELVGAVSVLIAGNVKNYYQSLKQPALAPASWVFPVVWVILYALMGIAAFLIQDSYSTDNDEAKKKALFIYYLQLFFNFSWSILFFKFKLMAASIAVSTVLLILIIIMTVKFFKIRTSTVFLLAPYLIWVAFATYLNIHLWLLNK